MDGIIFYIVIIVIGLVLSLVKKAAEKLEQSNTNSPKPAQKSTHSRLIKCPACFFPNPADSSFCICCGQRLKKEKPAPAAPLPQKIQQAPKKGREPLKSRIKQTQPTEEQPSAILEESRLTSTHPLLDDRDELAKAIVLKEILDRPLALRQK